MKVAIVSTIGELESVVGHGTMATVGRTEDTTALMLESPLLPLDENLLMINGSIEIQNYLLNPNIHKAINEQLGITGEPGCSSLYGFWNGEKFSDWLEVCFSLKLMSGNVGVEAGFTTGTALRVDCEAKLALPQIELIEKFLKETSYKGEVLLTITKDFKVTRLGFGHFYGHFGLYTELSRLGKVDGILEFLGGIQPELILGDALGIGNIVSLPPFPWKIPQVKSRVILAPQSAEKHLWRIRNEQLQFVYVTVRGLSLIEAKRRMRRTMDNMASYNPDIQYRIDYGHSTSSFVLGLETYQRMQEKRSFDVPQREKKVEQTDDKKDTKESLHIETSILPVV
jgi:hypothetical protein